MGLQAKIPLPKAIFNGFLLVTVRVLNSYEYRFICRVFRRKEDIMGSKASYQTKQMAQLLSYLRTVEGTHVTVADVCLHFKEQGITIGTTTVYRNLEKMVEQGLVAKYNVDGTSSACFEYLGAEEHCHKTSCFHCKCEKCGKLIHLHCEDVVKLEQHLMESHGFQMDPCRTVFYGICEECRKSEPVHIKGK